jgi:Photosynthesis system II assembly factor YCF48
MPELPNIVRERLKVSRAASAHPDPDVLTAFAELALPESERAVVLEHLARCHDCRDILALALPAITAVETVRAPLPSHSGWLRAPVLRWGVVAAGFAVLAVTGILQYPRLQDHSYTADLRREKASAANSQTAPADRADALAKPTPGTPGALAGSANSMPDNASRPNAGAVDAGSALVPSTKEAVASPGYDTTAHSAAGAMKSPQLTAALRPRAAVAGSFRNSPLAASAKQNSRLSRQQEGPASTGTVEGQSQLIAANPPDQPASQPFQYEAKSQGQGVSQSTEERSFMDVTVDKAKAPSPAPAQQQTLLAPRWAISPTGGLLRSFDQGRTWAIVDVNAPFSGANQMAVVALQSKKYQQATAETSQLEAQSQAESKTLNKSRAMSQKAAVPAVSIPIFRAVSAAGLEVWAGGSAGVLYHSADGGQQWNRVVPAASGILLTGDIVSIAFTDSLRGQLTTSTAEFWFTIDGGQSWQKR